MKPLKIPKSEWEMFIIPLQEASFWSKISLASIPIYLVIIFVANYFFHHGIVYFFIASILFVGFFMFCNFKEEQLRSKEYGERILEEETGIEVQEESRNVLKLFMGGKINQEEFDSRMANVFMTTESGRRYIPRILLSTSHKTIH